MHDKPDRDAAHHNVEPAERHLGWHGEPDRDAKLSYEEPANRRLDWRSAS